MASNYVYPKTERERGDRDERVQLVYFNRRLLADGTFTQRSNWVVKDTATEITGLTFIPDSVVPTSEEGQLVQRTDSSLDLQELGFEALFPPITERNLPMTFESTRISS